MTATIRAALDAAGRSLCFGPHGMHCDTCLTADQCRKPGDWNTEAANTIAAFLRALPSAGPMPNGKWLAAAVEAAAKEAGDG
jgi:hypothetical protein